MKAYSHLLITATVCLLFIVTGLIVRMRYIHKWQPAAIQLFVRTNTGKQIEKKTLLIKDSGCLFTFTEFNEDKRNQIEDRYGEIDGEVSGEKFNKGKYKLLIMETRNSHLISLSHPDIYVPAYSFTGSYYMRSDDKEKYSFFPSVSGGGYKVRHNALKERLLFVVYLDGFPSPFVFESIPPFSKQIKRVKDSLRNVLVSSLQFEITDINQMTPLSEYKYADEVKKALNL